MLRKSYIRMLDESNRVRFAFRTEKGIVQEFVAQYETRINDQWLPVVRYDTAHGYAHRDLVHPDGQTDKMSLGVLDYNEALTFAQQDIMSHWEDYLADYLKELNR